MIFLNVSVPLPLKSGVFLYIVEEMQIFSLDVLYFLQDVLALVGIIFFIVAGMALCNGFRMKVMLVTQKYFSWCWAVLKLSQELQLHVLPCQQREWSVAGVRGDGIGTADPDWSKCCPTAYNSILNNHLLFAHILFIPLFLFCFPFRLLNYPYLSQWVLILLFLGVSLHPFALGGEQMSMCPSLGSATMVKSIIHNGCNPETLI